MSNSKGVESIMKWNTGLIATSSDWLGLEAATCDDDDDDDDDRNDD